MATGDEVLLEDLPPELLDTDQRPGSGDDWEKALSQWAGRRIARIAPGETGLLEDALPKFERIMIEAALKQTGGRKRDAAILLGWGRNTLTRKIKELGLNKDKLFEN